MGRGRAKAKQTKVARELKYSIHETDYERLQRELAASTAENPEPDAGDEGSEDSDEYDRYGLPKG